MANWFRHVEDFLDKVDKTAANVAIVRDKSHFEESKISKKVDEQLAALEPTGIRTISTKPAVQAAIAPLGKPKGLKKSLKGSSRSVPDAIAINRPHPQLGSETAPAAHSGHSSVSLESLSGSGDATFQNGDKEPGELTEVNSVEGIPAVDSQNVIKSDADEIAKPLAAESIPAVNPLSQDMAGSTTDALPAVSQGGASENGHGLESHAESLAEGDAESNGEWGEESDGQTVRVSKMSTVQKELDEARGLLKSASATGQTKEARLARVCASLSQRLQEYKAENAQLEELLTSERASRGSMDSSVKVLEGQLAMAHAELLAAEASTAGALAAKNAELEAVSRALAEEKQQTAVLEAQLSSMQSNTEVMAKSRDVTEAKMIQALRDELQAAEWRFEEEKSAHLSTRQNATEREIELEQQLAESSSGVVRLQRLVDERTQKASDLEDKISVLELECANLSQELQSMEAKTKREQKRGGEDGMAVQIAAWRDEAERARNLQREAERKLLAFEAENQKLRAEVEALKREGSRESSKVQAELEKRFRELTELLYLKQTQLESMSCEKQALQMHLEKESRRIREMTAVSEKELMARKKAELDGSDEDDTELRSFESLGLHQRHIVGPRIQEAAKLLDRGTVTAGKFLWRRPLARLAVLFYLVFVHLFLMYLLHRLQEQADDFLSRDRASIAAEAAAGLVKPSH